MSGSALQCTRRRAELKSMLAVLWSEDLCAADEAGPFEPLATK